jgi:hypothetical protein
MVRGDLMRPIVNCLGIGALLVVASSASADEFIGKWAVNAQSCRSFAMHYTAKAVFDTEKSGFDCKITRKEQPGPLTYKLSLVCNDTTGDGATPTYKAIHTVTVAADRRSMKENVVLMFGHKTERNTQTLIRCP